MSDSDSDDQDWFNKDEEEILQSFQAKVSSNESKNTDARVEYIHGSSEADDYLQQKRLEASSELLAAPTVRKLPTAEMRKAINMEPLDIFLFVTTSEYDFYAGQITASDGLDRVLLYLRIWHVICKLELPGFQEELLQNFVKNEAFLEQWRVIVAKLFRKSYKTIWKSDEDVDEILNAIKSLILWVHKGELMTPKIYHVITHIKKLINESDNRDIEQRHACQQLVLELDRILSVKGMQLEEKLNETEIYPSLDDLRSRNSENFQTTNTVNKLGKHKVADYLTKQKQLLREDFMIPLREYVCKIKSSKPHSTTPELYEDVFIVLNSDFVNSKRHELVFIDILGTKRSMDNTKVKLSRKVKDKIASIKAGSLLLLTTSKNFEDLILATVTYTDGELLSLGYVGIQILRQENIVAVYDRQLLMFETPAFFEPYNNVYNYLNIYGAGDLPMKTYILDDEKDVNAPCYLAPETLYYYDREPFQVTAKNPSQPKNLALNHSQWRAYCQALTKEFCLIQGPPGTGKTHLSVHLIRTLIENVKTPIVLITYTNDSLDKFLLKLSAYTSNILRFGSQIRLPEISKFNVQFDSTHKELANPRLKRLYYVVNEEFKAKFQVVQQMHVDFDGTEESYQRLLQAQRAVNGVAEKLKTLRIMFQFYAAQKADVIAMTSTFAAKTNFLFRLLQSKVVIFEEAAEILESHVLACLTPYTEHVVMIGDHMQLQPYTSGHRLSGTYELNISLFERLFVNNLKGAILNIQYRMRPCLADLIHPTFYTDLNNDASVENYPKVRNMLTDLYFYTHNECECQSEDECSIYNDFEVTETLNLAKHLIEKAAYTADDIVILSPYAKQIETLKVRANKLLDKIQLNIATVDSFQGLEANIVLLSLVRSNSNGQIGFLKENNRICVALSRAKHGMYIIGNMPLLAKYSKTWGIIEQNLKTRGLIGDKFPLINDEE
ncbi:PREDICTED: NFX1-type zinc finger-containing protein 1 [Rhagoletis zephyria]|uniref:NFX1-type zinc finger-containing protein 1 n=1 Tax=Rhagoletis zephyria TaxID=28612 RepID=UPI0008119884|nr:PREDICTED: NFX1-type zinc finger-containing protein 1 [Rhagoletis zephyria]